MEYKRSALMAWLEKYPDAWRVYYDDETLSIHDEILRKEKQRQYKEELRKRIDEGDQIAQNQLELILAIEMMDRKSQNKKKRNLIRETAKDRYGANYQLDRVLFRRGAREQYLCGAPGGHLPGCGRPISKVEPHYDWIMNTAKVGVHETWRMCRDCARNEHTRREWWAFVVSDLSVHEPE